MDGIFTPSHLLVILQEMAAEVEAAYKAGLIEHGREASGDLLRSIRTEVEVTGTTYEVVMDLRDYWQYVENGTKPHWPPKAAIDRWIFIKPVLPRPDKNGKIPTPEQLSFLIRRKIAREGTEGSHDLQNAKDAVLHKYEARILEALHRDAIDYIEKIAL